MTQSSSSQPGKPQGRFRAVHFSSASGVLLLACVLAVLWYLDTPHFSDFLRRKVIAQIEQATGGRVELEGFRWNLLHLSVEADGLTIHGVEAPQEVPYAHVDRMLLQLKLTSIFHAAVTVRSLELEHPVVHILVYPDGSTNQPTPRVVRSSAGDPIKTVFDLRAGRVMVHRGVFLFNQRNLPFNFSGREMGLQVRYESAPDTYQAKLQIGDITTSLFMQPDVHSKLEAALTLGRSKTQLTALHWYTSRSDVRVTGQLANYQSPVVDFEVHGKAALRDIGNLSQADELVGGVTTLDIRAHGDGWQNFLARGKVHVTGGAYYDPYLELKDVTLETPFTWTSSEIRATDVNASACGGQIVHGTYTMVNWLNQADGLLDRKFDPKDEPRAEFAAELRGISLPQLLRSVLSRRYSELGLDARINGRASGGWHNNPVHAFVSAQADLVPEQGVDGVPASGSVDATYTGQDETVSIRNFELQTPASSLQAEGVLDVGLKNRRTALLADLTTTNLAEFNPIFSMLGVGNSAAVPSQTLPVQLHGQAAFHGELQGPLTLLEVNGHLDVSNFNTRLATTAGQPARDLRWDSLHTEFAVAPQHASVTNLVLAKGTSVLHASADLVADAAQAKAYAFDEHAAIHGEFQINGASMADLAEITGQQGLPVTGKLNAVAQVQGQLDNLRGKGHLALVGGTIYGEPFKQLNADLVADHSDVGVANLVFLQNGGRITGNGGYDFSAGNVHADLTGIGFELAHLQSLQGQHKTLSGAVAFHVNASGPFASPNLQANFSLQHAALGTQGLGSIHGTVHTQSHVAYLDVASDMLQSNLQMHGQVAMQGDYNTQATLTVTDVDAQPLLAILLPQASAVHTSLAGSIHVAGPLRTPKLLDVEAGLSKFQLKYDPYTLTNQGPLQVSVRHGLLQIDSFHILGPDTDLTAHGTADVFGKRELKLQVNGAVNLGVAQSFNRSLVSSGHVDIALDADGTLDKPDLRGKVTIVNGNLADIDFPNGLSALNGTMEFNQDRLELRKLCATTGGGTVALGGFLTYQSGLYADITANAKNVRVRYPEGLSSTADATLHLVGSQQQAILSGNVLLTRFGIVGSLGLGGMSTSVAAPPDPEALSSHVQLDVHLTSAPELSFENSYATLVGQVDLRIRGSVAAPSVLGKVQITQGSANLAGTQYQLQRGQVFFSNPMRIDPIIDLDATAQVRDYDISLGVHGTMEKLSTTYRSQPPLPQSDIIALLALGRTQEEAQIYQQEQTDAGVDPTTNALLGGALNATVSNRVQKLFGVGQVKIDPNFVGSLGQSSARVTVTQQVTKAVTLTYATNVNETSQQLIQAQINLTRDISLVAVRDEAGVFSLLVHVRQRHR